MEQESLASLEFYTNYFWPQDLLDSNIKKGYAFIENYKILCLQQNAFGNLLHNSIPIIFRPSSYFANLPFF